jgi:hypothetical protein
MLRNPRKLETVLFVTIYQAYRYTVNIATGAAVQLKIRKVTKKPDVANTKIRALRQPV